MVPGWSQYPACGGGEPRWHCAVAGAPVMAADPVYAPADGKPELGPKKGSCLRVHGQGCHSGAPGANPGGRSIYEEPCRCYWDSDGLQACRKHARMLGPRIGGESPC